MNLQKGALPTHKKTRRSCNLFAKFSSSSRGGVRVRVRARARARVRVRVGGCGCGCGCVCVCVCARAPHRPVLAYTPAADKGTN